MVREELESSCSGTYIVIDYKEALLTDLFGFEEGGNQ